MKPSSLWPNLFAFLIILLLLLYAYDPAFIQAALTFLGAWLMMLLYVILVAIVGGLLVLAWLLYRKQQLASTRPVDGAYPLQRFKTRDGRTMVVNANHMVSAAAIIDPHTGHYTEVEHPAGWEVQSGIRGLVERTNMMRAIYPGDQARMNANGAMSAMPRVGALDRPAKPQQAPRVIGAERPQLPPPVDQPRPVAPPIALPDAIRQSTPDKWIIGQSPETGALATLNLRTSIHAGIIGATGTGKTASLGYLMAAHAVRSGYHVVILDPKGGADWRPWQGVAEWHESDRTTFGDQVRAVEAEHERRALAVRRAELPNVMALPAPPRPILVVIEEYGDLIAQMRQAKAGDAAKVDDMLDRLLRLSRMTDIHLLMIDQYPEHWSNQVLAGTKAKAVFQLGPNQGAKVQEYQANQLPDVGRYLLKSKQYDAWHAAPNLGSLLRTLPARTGPDVVGVTYRVGEGVRSSEGNREGINTPVEQSANLPPNHKPNPADKQQAVWAWRSANPTATNQAQMRRELLEQGIMISKGHASDCWNAWPGPPTGAEQLAQMGYDISEVQVKGRKVT